MLRVQLRWWYRMDELEILQRRVAREREARKAAEHLLEERSRALYESHQSLLARHEQLAEAKRELEALHLQLLASEKLAAIGQLAAGVAHEINTPLGFVRSNLATLQRYGALMLSALAAAGDRQHPDEHRRAAARANWEQARQHPDWPYLAEDLPALLAESISGLDRVKAVVQDLRDFSRVGDSSGWERVSLEQELRRALRLCQGRIQDQARVVCEFNGAGELRCQPSRLNQVFLNLLDNALQALSDRAPEAAGGHSTIWLRAGSSARGDEVWMEIEDSGPGIRPEVIGKVFDPFFSTRPVGRGAGLGLALAWGIVREHAGRIEVQSPPGRGACFRVSLPREPAPA